MDQLVEFELRDGGSILVETTDARGGPVTRGGRGGGEVVKAGSQLEDVVGRVGPAIRGVVDELREAADWPDEVEIELGVRISSEAGVILARAGGEANFRIVMRWKPDRPSDD